MAHSVESRVPFLDYRLVEFAFALPWRQRIRHGTRKYILRNAMKGILPEPVLNRQDKIGLDTPEHAWLRNHLEGEVFEPLRDPHYFRTVRVHPELDTIVWENGADFSPDFLHEIGEQVDAAGATKVKARSGSDG